MMGKSVFTEAKEDPRGRGGLKVRFESDVSGAVPGLQACWVVMQRHELWKLQEGPGKTAQHL